MTETFAEFCRTSGTVPGDTVQLRWKSRDCSIPFVVTAIGEKLILVKNPEGIELALGRDDDAAMVETLMREVPHG